MDTRTGEIHDGNSKFLEGLEKELPEGGFEKFVKFFDAGDMTEKQKENKIVSKHDSRSKLGILRRKAINDIGRNSPCPCGSGKKFKKCCLGLGG